ncbi:MAG: AAA family ATPase [bacterium]|nr:AAA family ATPase [bacterium]
MTEEKIIHIIRQGEGMGVEFKEAARSLPKNIFETICAFLNREGGTLLLGVDDAGNLSGVAPGAVEKLKMELITLSNNPQKLFPPFMLFPQTMRIEGKFLLIVQVSVSSQVHCTGEKIFDRSGDGDFKVSDPIQIAELVNRKQLRYSERKIFPYVSVQDFEQGIFSEIRNLLSGQTAHHPWLSLDNEQMLKKSGLYSRDPLTGREGYNLAAILLFGKEEVIQQTVPHYKIDALVRKKHVNRYDDRYNIRKNLIRAYELLMEFIRKHLDDPFFLQGNVRISLRDRIFREIVANLLIHREYTNAYPSTFTVYSDRVEVKNACVAHGYGPIDPLSFTPYPKNPIIAKFFLQLGWVEELGSGVLNVNEYLTHYTPGAVPQFIEGNVFETIIPLASPSSSSRAKSDSESGDAPVSDPVTAPVSRPVSDSVSKQLKHLLELCQIPASSKELRQHLGLKHRTHFRNSYLKPALQAGLLEMTIPGKPNSRLQKYRITQKGRMQLQSHAPG